MATLAPPTRSLDAQLTTLRSAAVSSSGRLALTYGVDVLSYVLSVWDLATDTEIRRIHLGGAPLVAHFTPDETAVVGALLARDEHTASIVQWSLSETEDSGRILYAAKGIDGMTMSRNAATVALWGPTGGITVFDVVTESSDAVADATVFGGVALSPRGTLIAAASDPEIQVLARSGEHSSVGFQVVARNEFGPVQSLDCSDTAVVATSGQGVSVIYGTASAQPASGPELVRRLAFSTDGSVLAVAYEKSVDLIGLATGTVVRELPTVSPVDRLTFSLNDRYLVTAHGDGVARIWDLADEPGRAEDSAGGQRSAAGTGEGAPTSGLDAAGVVQVRAAVSEGERFVSGYFLTESLVLTVAWITEGTDCVVRHQGAQAWLPATVAWKGAEAALLNVVEPRSSEPLRSLPRLGRLVSTASFPCRAVGFPSSHPEPRRMIGDAEELIGEVQLSRGTEAGTLTMHVTSSAPRSDAPGDLSNEPWRGIGGAAVFVGRFLVGIISRAPPGDAPRMLGVTPVDQLVGDVRFRQMLHAQGFEEVRVETVPAEAARSEPAEPDADSVARPAAVLPVYDADAVADTDFVGIGPYVNAFANVIASKETKPPLAIGLFGNWGSGKSFLMRAVRRQVDTITRAARESGRAQKDIGAFKQVVQIEFNAWHYVEGDLWASLVDQIFSNLRVSPEEQESVLSRREQEVTQALDSIKDRKRALDQSIDSLRDEQEAREQDRLDLAEKHKQQLESVQQIRAGDIAAAVKLGPADVQALNEAVPDSGFDAAADSAVDASRSLADARDLIVHAGPVLAAARRLGWKGTAVFAGVLLVAAVVISLLLSAFDASVLTRVLTSVGALLSAVTVVVGTGVRWADGALARIQTAEARVRARVEQKAKEQAREVGRLLQEIEERKLELAQAITARDQAEGDIRTLERERDGLTPGKLLADFLDERSETSDYRKHLGVTALVRRDFERLSQLIEENNEAELAGKAPVSTSGPHEFNRIVLYVDDLDRCPPKLVVEVLQAVHLLLSFPIFVVVVAVDARWLAQSLTVEYPKLLGDRPELIDDRMARPSDYLEKIFQVPFSIAPLDLGGRRRFLRGLLAADVAHVNGGSAQANGGSAQADGRGAQADGGGPAAVKERPPVVPPSATTRASAGAVAPAAETASEIVRAPEEEARARDESPELSPARSDRSTPPLEETVELSPASLRFSSTEAAYLERLLPLLESSPRSLKRYVNIYRLIKSTTGISTAADGPASPQPYEHAMWLLALQTGLLRLGPRLVSMIAESDRGRSGDGPLTVGELLEQVGSTGETTLELGRLRDWLEGDPDVSLWSISVLAPLARNVRLYSFT